ncbi:MAG: hypothetical protein HOO06_09305 [Bdellovibrionaceae bacterium]|jgi:hypothetical protein|nr:hypothetical protein [Pseudobdellovibrionaceae bacterium]
MTENADLKIKLKRLEQLTQKIMKTQGYNKEIEKVKVLEELIREQFKNENTNSSTRQIR